MNELDPLLTVFVDHPDYGASDARAEADRLCQRQRAIAGLLDYTTAIEDCLDLLSDQGIEPNSWIDAVVENIEWAMQGDLIIPA